MVVLSIAVMTCNAIGAVYVIVGVVSIVARVVAAGFIVVWMKGGGGYRYFDIYQQFCNTPSIPKILLSNDVFIATIFS